MQVLQAPVTTDLVLIGGGHSHAIALKLWGMNPLPGIRLTLITETVYTPYSGMLPGHVAGFYDFDETHIDLRRLARFAGAQLYLDRAIALDLSSHHVICQQRPPVRFDLLSLDIGSTPQVEMVPGAAEYAIPAKPVPDFLAAWEKLVADVQANPRQYLAIAIVGGGAGGVELALNMHHRLTQIFQQAGQPENRLTIHLFHRQSQLLSQHNPWARQRLQTLLQQRGIQLYLGEQVSDVGPNYVMVESGRKVGCDRLFWVTQGTAPRWLKAAGLTTDTRGFLWVNDALQSISHPQVFGAGDIATMANYARPKAGVFAVRQGKPLYENLRRAALGQSLQPFRPQQRYLSLIGTGERRAIATWANWGWQGGWVWRWKDHIDRKFMKRFSNLPLMETSVSSPAHASTPFPPTMRCSGCGGKVNATVLSRVLKRLTLETSSDLLVGLDAPDDAAVVKVPSDHLMVHTVDFFRSFLDDPYLFGQISTHHCLNDLYAMGAQPQSVLAIASLPYSHDLQMEETLFQLLSGALRVLEETQTPLVGGHTNEGHDLAFGLTCNGLGEPDQLWRKGGVLPGQGLILTKALGTGTLLAAEQRCQAQGRWLEGAIASMVQSNYQAMQIFREHHVSACTDVTGFGLLGHLLEMLQASGVGAELELDVIPLLEGAITCFHQGIESSIQAQNRKVTRQIQRRDGAETHPHYPLLFDPQTSGGLLAAMPSEQVAGCLEKLRSAGYQQARCIGQTRPLIPEKRLITLSVAEVEQKNSKS